MVKAIACKHGNSPKKKCKACQKEYQKIYRELHKDELKAQQRAYQRIPEVADRVRKYHQSTQYKKYQKKWDKQRWKQQKDDPQYIINRREYYKKYYKPHPIQPKTDWEKEYYSKIEPRLINNKAQLKKLVLTYYGGKQLKCVGLTKEGCPSNASDIDILSIDHVNNDGSKQRKSGEVAGNGRSYNLYRWLVKNNFPKGYQTLCWNCQHKKERIRQKQQSKPQLEAMVG